MVVRKLKEKIVEEQWPIWLLPGLLFALVALASIGFFMFYFGPRADIYAGRIPEPSYSRQQIGIEVNGILFVVPAHYTRYAPHRRGGAQDHLSLHALLPALTPYTRDAVQEFLRTDAKSQLVLINLAGLATSFDPNRYLDKLLAQDNKGSAPAPKGLRGYRMRSGAYRGRDVFVSRGNAIPRRAFICDVAGAPSPNCTSRFRVGNAVIADYTFKRAYLGGWQQIDDNMRALLKSFRANARTFRN